MAKRFIEVGGEKGGAISEGRRQEGTYENGEICGLMKRREKGKHLHLRLTECHELCQHFLVHLTVSIL